MDKKIGDVVVIEPGYYWFHERMPRWMGSAFQFTFSTKFKITGDRGNHWVMENVEPVATEPKVFYEGQMTILVLKCEEKKEKLVELMKEKFAVLKTN